MVTGGHETSAIMILETAENLLQCEEGNKNCPEPLYRELMTVYKYYSYFLSSCFLTYFNSYSIKMLVHLMEAQILNEKCSLESQIYL